MHYLYIYFISFHAYSSQRYQEDLGLQLSRWASKQKPDEKFSFLIQHKEKGIFMEFMIISLNIPESLQSLFSNSP
jgi:hypothetical protein